MANIVKIKRSAVASKIPTTADLELGELAINTFDGKLFTRKDDGTASIIEIGSGGGGGGITYSLKTANYTASDKDGILANTTAGSFTVTLPASPAIGASVVINDAADSFGTNNLTVARNGSTIETIADNLTLDLSSVSVSLIYTGTTWQVYSLVVAAVPAGTYATGTGSASGTNTGDNAVNSLYSGLVSNATHTGDVTGSTALTLATVNSNIGTWNNVTVNAKGLVTGGSNTSYLTTVSPSNFSSQTANTILAAPNGSAGVPTFRAIVAADIPVLNQNTTGTASNVTGTVAIANGGTGATTAAAALTALGAYAATNPSGYTTNIGTVTSVGGTGSVSGLTLSGTVTGSGNLTLGGTLSLTSGNVTTALGFTPYNATNPSGYITSSGSITGSSGSTTGNAVTSTSAGALYANTGAVSSGLQVWNEISNTTLNPTADWYYGLRVGHGDAATYYSATLAIPFFSDSLFMRRKVDGVDNTWKRFWHNGDASITASTDFSAPIFKDSDNSAYYVDPASTSILRGLTLSNGSPAMTFSSTTSTRSAAFGMTDAYNMYLNGPNDGALILGGFRAPIFYDSDDTAYYINSASTSILSALTLGGRPTTNAVYYSGFSLDANTMAANSTGFTYSVNAPATGPIARLGDGGYSLQLNAPYAGNGNKLFYRTRQGDAGVFNPWFSVATYDVNYGSGELYATKFSDAVNSGYYLNPDSTSALYDAIIIGPNPSWAAYLRVGGNGANSDMATVAASNGNLHMDSKNAGYHMYLNHSSNGNIMMGGGGGYAESYSSMRATIFYDSNNTGFYIDASATSVQSRVNVLGGMNLTGQLALVGSGATLDNATGARLTENYGPVWDLSNSATWHHQVINGSMLCGFTAAGTNWGAGKIIASADMRAPIFYDSNNTVYYVDPAVSSTMDRILLRKGGISMATGNSCQLEINNANDGVCNISFHRENQYGAHFGLNSDNWFSTTGFSAGGGFTSMRVGNLAATGGVTATGDITAYFSDRRLKENITVIENPIEKIMAISGVTFNSNDTAAGFGYTNKKRQLGVIAQEIASVLPEIVLPAPFDIALDENGNEYSKSGENYKTVQYEKIIPLLIEAIKEQQASINRLEDKLNLLENK